MLNDKGFDLWADGYDKSVGIPMRETHTRLRGTRRCWAIFSKP